MNIRFSSKPVGAISVLILVVVSGRLSLALADDPATNQPSKTTPPFRPVKDASEAIQRIKALEGVVRFVAPDHKFLEVDFRFAVEDLQDEHLQYVLSLQKVVSVRLKRTPITNAGLVHLGKLASLERLYLEETSISDTGLKHLAALSKLKILNLYGTRITDAGLDHLKSLTSLERLFVGETQVTGTGVAPLKKSVVDLLVFPDHAERRRRAQLVIDVAKKLLAETEKLLGAAEKQHTELTPKVGALKKAEDATKAKAEETKKKSDTAKQQQDAANKVAAEAVKEAEAARKASSDKPDDEDLKKQAQQKQKAADEATTKSKAGQQKYTEAKQLADKTKTQAEKAKQQHERAKKAKPAFDLAKRVHDAAQLRLTDARRRQVQSPGAPFAPKQDALPTPPPDGATILFDGSEKTGFLSKTGEAINWPIEKGELVSTKGGSNSNHIVSAVHFRDAVIHVEFMLSPQGSGNSGVYIHGNYELQIIRSHEKTKLSQKDMGALYGFAKPLVNAARPPGEWQVYDILYRAPRRDQDQKIVEKGSITAWLNGKKVQDKTRFGEPRSVYHPYRHGTTPYLKAIWDRQKKTMTGPVFLQDHGHPTRFRNVWLLPLDDQSSRYEPAPAP